MAVCQLLGDTLDLKTRSDSQMYRYAFLRSFTLHTASKRQSMPNDGSLELVTDTALNGDSRTAIAECIEGNNSVTKGR